MGSKGTEGMMNNDEQGRENVRISQLANVLIKECKMYPEAPVPRHRDENVKERKSLIAFSFSLTFTYSTLKS
jgi:hypothetical protein